MEVSVGIIIIWDAKTGFHLLGKPSGNFIETLGYYKETKIDIFANLQIKGKIVEMISLLYNRCYKVVKC